MHPQYSLMALITIVSTMLAEAALASSYSYFEEITGMSGNEAKKEHQCIIDWSNEWSFLDCPIELIERQWQGPESVKIGIDYFLQILKESLKDKPIYKTISEKCLETLNNYRKKDLHGLVAGRALLEYERESLWQELPEQASLKEKDLIGLVVAHINEPTQCQINRVALNMAAMIGGGIGLYQMDCFTPLGRRFKLRGPSIGLGLGLGGSVVLPKRKAKNRLAYNYKLYQLAESSWWKMHYNSLNLSLVVGVSIESDRPHWASKELNGEMLYNKYSRPALGLHASIEDIYNYMRLKKQEPFYLKLSKSGILN